MLPCCVHSSGARKSAHGLQAVQAQQKALVSSPIRSLVCRHAGPVHAVAASLFDPGMVISAGLDGQVRVCSSLARQPLLELAPSDSYLFSAQWSPHRPMLFAVGAGEERCLLPLTTVTGNSARKLGLPPAFSCMPPSAAVLSMFRASIPAVFAVLRMHDMWTGYEDQTTVHEPRLALHVTSLAGAGQHDQQVNIVLSVL